MSYPPKRILVSGAGVAGSEVLQQLAKRGHRARALVRDLDRAAHLVQLGVEPIQGNFAHGDAWKRAMDGMSAAFVITPAHSDAVAWNRVFLDCAKACGLGKVVQLSGMNVSPASTSAFHRRMSACDEALESSGLAWTILRPNVFQQNMLVFANAIRELHSFASAVGDAPISMIDVRDVAECAIGLLEDGEQSGQVHVLTGPETLTYFDVARWISEAIGYPISYEPQIESDAVGAMTANGVPEPVARARVELHRSFSSGAFAPVTGTVEALLGRPPRTFAAFARDYADAFKRA
jgi:uncharacterized protein YbjT (DUF2867 family)